MTGSEPPQAVPESTTVRAPWATGPEWDNWGATPVERMAEVEAEEVLLGRVPPNSDLLPETRRILSARDAWLTAAREPEPDPELEAG
jgi:hypothetical protein